MKPYLSVIIPCRNEAEFLGAALDSVLASDYPAERLEVLVADGMSTDGTRDLLDEYARRHSQIRRVDNPARVTPAGLNRAIEASRGDVIVRLDAHATIAADYLSRAVAHLEERGADNVGGAMRTVARDKGPLSNAIRLALAHPFGVGNSHFRTRGADKAPFWVDTVFGGCWRREVFDRIGMFNESLARGQDMEFNVRLARAGGRILLAPDMRSDYYARAALGAFIRHTWTNGVWAILPFAYSKVVPVRWRHLAPMGFVAGLLGVCLAALTWGGAQWWPALAAALYLGTSLCVSVALAARERDPILAMTLPIVFGCLHLAYGAGSLWGLTKLAGIAAWRLFRTAVPQGEMS
jgi:cellulose synthase/poly-beta-1,6-N-acetylglucosamine synthase-like glycosyltransferase